MSSSITKHIYTILLIASILLINTDVAATVLFQSPNKSFDHAYQGCPEDSICSKALSLKFDYWIKNWRKQKNNVAKNNFIKKNGFPFFFFSKQAKAPDGESFASWNTKCFFHKKNNVYKNLGILKKITSKENIMNQIVYVYIENEWKLYQLPINFTPMLFDKDTLIGLLEFEKKILSFSFDDKHTVKLLEAMPIQANNAVLYQQRVTCPESVKDLPLHKDYFLDRYCQTILDKKKKEITTLRYWSCP